MRTDTYIRKYALITYWLLFAMYTLYMAQFPGLISHPERWTYPWMGVLVVWALLGVLVAVLHFILRPMTYHYSWARLLGALGYSAALLVLGVVSVVTDMPGYYYVFAMFTVITMAALLTFGVVQAVAAMWRKRAA